MKSVPTKLDTTCARDVAHIGITVSDLDGSIDFYSKKLGFEVRARWIRDEEYIGQLVGYPGVTLHAAILGLTGVSTLVELIEYRDVGRHTIDPRSANPATAHLSLAVDRLDAFVGRLVADGVELVGEVVTPTVGPNRGGRAAYIADPDGFRIELTESVRRLDDVATSESVGAGIDQ